MSEETWALEQRIAELEAQLALLANNNPDLFSGPGRMHFGGKVMRLDKHGIQIVAPETGIPGVYFVPEFSETPEDDTVSHAEVIGYSSPDPSGLAQVDIRAASGEGEAYATAFVGGGTNYTAVKLYAEDYDASYIALVELRAGSTHPAFEIDGVPLALSDVTSDYSDVLDGDLWYRSDTDKFRARVNGATENLATEDYVDTAVAGVTVTGGFANHFLTMGA